MFVRNISFTGMLKPLALAISSLMMISQATAKSDEFEVNFPINRIQVDLDNETILPDISGFTGPQKSVKELNELIRQVEDKLSTQDTVVELKAAGDQDITEGNILFKATRYSRKIVKINDPQGLAWRFPSLEVGNIYNAGRIQNERIQYDRFVRAATEGAPNDPGQVMIETKMTEAGVEVDIHIRHPLEMDKDIALSGNTIIRMDDGGSGSAGRLRGYAIYQNNNVNGNGLGVTLLGVGTVENLEKSNAVFAEVRQPFVKKSGQLDASYMKSSSNAGKIMDLINISGSGSITTVRWNSYGHLYDDTDPWITRTTVSLEEKRFTNSVLLDGFSSQSLIPSYGSRVVGLDFGAQYFPNGTREALIPMAKGRIGLYVNLLEDDQHLYRQVRADAEKNYWYTKGDYRFIYDFNKNQLGNLPRIEVSGQYQWTKSHLLPTEQFGAGGIYSVRGYSEREVSGDSGIYSRLEISEKVWDNASFVAFHDVGEVAKNDPMPGEYKRFRLSSAGLGMKFNYRFGGMNTMFEIYYAKALTEGVTTHHNDDRVNAVLTTVF